ncbi:MarR family winged helix-turn-helix transcriptional regulator [Antrihabitans cavernicola]|uniref:MarR family transcriptional regulator n=1 Tax=Antrihabitans cavernicola TaxID=2495913 RepID=A0A5A7SJS5_9NOCA|nr:hypothetical protein [Spelaeibacter cavernicola]KAA0025017.1 hypothetical protein FOY51_03645 [Spelaeibacter cavernicola]
MPYATMQPPARQPIGFWTARAAEAVRTRTRGALADIGVSQPEWWVLHQLSTHPGGIDRRTMIDTIGHNDTVEAVETALDDATAKGWVTGDDSALRSTDLGTDMFDRAAAVQRDLQDERMRGISEAEFATTITVLQRTIANVGGDAWHW